MSGEKVRYANVHIPAFLALFDKTGTLASSSVQVVHDGRQLTADSFKQGELDISRPVLVKDTPESIGMTVYIPSAVREGLEERVSVRHIADVIGHNYPVRVMDVEHQEELKGWTLGDLVDYFEDKNRLRLCQSKPQSPHQSEGEEHKDDNINTSNALKYRSRRKAAEKASNLLLSERDRPRILNQISLEFSRTPLGALVASPQFVRDLDWIGNCWPREQRQNAASYPCSAILLSYIHRRLFHRFSC